MSTLSRTTKVMSQKPPSQSLAAAIEAALRFAEASGARLVAGAPLEGGAGRLCSDADVPLPDSAADALRAAREDLGDCHRCRLWEGRTHIVFGTGDPCARVLFVGEAPGEEEDHRGEPFVGRAGRLLDLMIQALGMERRAVYIANVLKCRPPGNRDPAADEVASCLPFLWRQIDAIRPKVICALGSHAARNLLGVEAAVGSLRGRAHRVRGRIVLPTYHPAYLLRNPLAKRSVWQDLQTLRRLLEEEG